MPAPAKRRATYDDLYSIPDNMIGQIINSELHTMPRPSRRHAFTAGSLFRLTPSYRMEKDGGGAPGGWVILIEPEISFGEDIFVPDLAGWKLDRFPMTEDHNWISIAPDWVCEILSPATAKIDKTSKMPIYGQYGVPFLWLIDPAGKTLDVFQLANKRWVVLGFFFEDDNVRTEPFPELEFNLNILWIETLQKPQPQS